MRRLASWVLRRNGVCAVVPATGPIRVVVFDFDGTLADTFQAGWDILNTLAAEYKYRRLEAEDLDRARDMTTRQLMKFLGIPARKLPAISRQGVQRLRAHIHSIQPLPGIPEMLRELQEGGIRLGIVTSNSEENVAVFTRNHGLEVFDFVRTSSRLLGKAREIRQVLKLRQVPLCDTLYVGDETRDIEACRKAGIRCAAVTWGYNSRKALEAQAPHWMLDKPSDLPELVRVANSAG